MKQIYLFTYLFSLIIFNIIYFSLKIYSILNTLNDKLFLKKYINGLFIF